MEKEQKQPTRFSIIHRAEKDDCTQVGNFWGMNKTTEVDTYPKPCQH